MITWPSRTFWAMRSANVWTRDVRLEIVSYAVMRRILIEKFKVSWKKNFQISKTWSKIIYISIYWKIAKDMRSEQKNLTQYVELCGKPCNDAWTGNSAVMGKALTQRLPKISTKQLISIKSKPYHSHRADSERSLIRSIASSSRSSLRRRPSSGDSGAGTGGGRSSSTLGHCYHGGHSGPVRRLKRY